MSLLQRPPIDVHASIGCTRAPELLRDSATRLLEASDTLFPYAGAIVRSAVTKPEIAEIRGDDADLRLALLEAADFLQPVNEAMQEWWGSTPLNTGWLEVKDLYYSGNIWDQDTERHIDQGLNTKLPSPQHGPLTALLITGGSTEYELEVLRKNPLKPGERDYFLHQQELPKPRKTAKIAAKIGDIVLFTNVPPTIHTARSITDTRVTAIYHTRFHITETVE